MMTLFLIAVLAGVGASHIIVDGTIFAKLRGWIKTKFENTKPWIVELIICYMCSAMYTGAFFGLILQPFSWYSVFSKLLPHWAALLASIPFYVYITPFIVGCATSYCSMAGAALLNFLDRR